MEEPGVAAPGWEFCGVVRDLDLRQRIRWQWAALGWLLSLDRSR